MKDLESDFKRLVIKKIEIPSIYQDVVQRIQDVGFESIENAIGFLEDKSRFY